SEGNRSTVIAPANLPDTSASTPAGPTGAWATSSTVTRANSGHFASAFAAGSPKLPLPARSSSVSAGIALSNFGTAVGPNGLYQLRPSARRIGAQADFASRARSAS